MRSVCASNTVSCPASTMWQNFILFGAVEPAKCQNTLANLFSTNGLRRTFLLFAHRKVAAIRVYERQRTHAGFRVHHESLS